MMSQAGKVRLAASLKQSVLIQLTATSTSLTHTAPPRPLKSQQRHQSALAQSHSHSHQRNDRQTSQSFGVGAATIASLAAAMGVTIILADDRSSAASAPSSIPVIPVPSLGVPTAGGVSTGARTRRPRAAAKKRDERPSLPNPGKFDHTHREASNITNSHAFSGAQLQTQLPLFPTSQSPDQPHIEKQMMLAPFVQLSPEGQVGMLNVRTELGHKHVLEAMLDTNYNMIGKYKWVSAPWTRKINYRCIQQQGEEITLEADYKGADFVAQGTLSLQGQAVESIWSYHQAITRSLSLGAQLHAVMPHMTFLNLTGRYVVGPNEIVSATYKHHVAQVSYYRTAYETPSTNVVGPTRVDMATELKVHTGNKASELSVGALITRQTFTCNITANSEPTLSMMLRQQLPGSMIILSVAGEIKYDGSNESRFGVGLQVG